MEAWVCIIRTSICGSLGPRITWYMGPASMGILAQEHKKWVKFKCMAAY